VAGTKIRTEHGLVDIEDVKVGDKVWSRNLATGRDELQSVVQTYVRHAGSLLKLTIAGAVLTTTKDHPFWVQGKGWTKAGDLHAGDTLVTPGGTTPLTAVTPVAKGATVYNFQVAVNHDYYALAGDTPVLVHNADYPGRPPGWGTPRGNQAQNKQFNDAIRTGERQIGRRLSKDERRQVHDEISGQGYSFQEIVDEVVGRFGGGQ
jgi:mRNA-degrading endonuclease toxin of MazEF toxin-antitoxin module